MAWHGKCERQMGKQGKMGEQLNLRLPLAVGWIYIPFNDSAQEIIIFAAFLRRSPFPLRLFRNAYC
jgi:hypothetical protein